MLATRPKVVLVIPNLKWAKSEIHTYCIFWPYNLCMIASLVKDISNVSILDANIDDLSQEQFSIELKKLNPDIVGITVHMDAFAEVGHLAAKLVKSFNIRIKIILGGVYPTVNSAKAIADSNVDFVILGEGEQTFRDLVKYFMNTGPIPNKGICYKENNNIINTGKSELIKDLDELPFPAYDLIDFNKYAESSPRKRVDSPRLFPFARIVTSRGCPYNCIFCQVESIMGKKFRARSAENVLNEIEWLQKEYKIESIVFDDDNLFTDRGRAKSIFQGMIDRNIIIPWISHSVAVFKLDEEMVKLMKQSGCEYINIAIESGSNRVLKEIINKPVDLDQAKEIVKLAKKENIYVAANFIVGFPTETWNEIRQTIKYAEDIDVDYVKIYSTIPLPNTKLWDLCKKENAFKNGFDESNMKWLEGQIETKEFSANDLTFLRAYEWERINFTDLQKRKKTAEMMGVTEQELFEIRRSTLKNAAEKIK